MTNFALDSRRLPASVWLLMLLAWLTTGCAPVTPAIGDAAPPETLRLQLPAGTGKVDVYWPSVSAPAPLVIVAHGFARGRQHMAGWGQQLAAAGYVAVVPDLPARADHARNGRFLTELRAHLLGDAAWQLRIDPSRVGLMGFSAGGLATLLSAAEKPGVAIWIGLDPVDRDGLGARAAARVQSRAVAILAEPSACNAQGNAREMLAALPRLSRFVVAGAVHVDAEWPTSAAAELVCGRSTDARRAEFRGHVMQALGDAFAPPPMP